MKKIRVTEEGKMFEAYVKMLMIDDENIVGMGIAGNMTSIRAIHASLYGKNGMVLVYDEETGFRKYYRSTRFYRRLEVLNGKVCHAFFLPRTAIEKEFETSLREAEQNEEPKPERLIIAPSNKIESEVGLFLASVYGLPRTKEWADKYLSLLQEDKWSEIDVETTELMDNSWKEMRAIKINSMTDNEVLDIIESGIHSRDLNTVSDLTSEAVFREGMTTEEYLRENANSLAAHIDKHMTPQYDGTHFIQSIGETKRVSLPAQARMVMGSLEVLKKQKADFIVATMGGGKTQIALTTAYTMMKERERTGAKDGMRVLIVAPSIIIPKWETSEIPTILGNDVSKVTVINTTEDALKYVRKIKKGNKPKKGTIEFILVSTDRMKLGANKYVLGANWDSIEETWDCPDCGNPIISPSATQEEPDMLASWSDAVIDPIFSPSTEDVKIALKDKQIGANGVPTDYIKKWSNKIRRFECHHCAMTEESDDNESDEKRKVIQKNHSLVRPALKSKGEDKVKPRWMIAQIFQRTLSNHFQLGIYDEIQMFKSSGSGRGLSFHKLLKSTRKNLFLTGTLTNGEASSIQATLWRSDPKSLLDDGFTHQSSEVAWARRYGVLEEVTHRKDSGIIGATTNRRQQKTILKTKPGISPKLTANHLLHKSVFLDLSDLGLPLVKKEEIPVIIPLDEEHKNAYKRFHSELYDTCLDMQKELGSAAWARFNPATLNYADQPHIEQNIEFKGEDNEYLAGVYAEPIAEDYITAKERKFIEIVQQNLDEQRGCIVYNHFTGSYKQNERLKKILHQKGIEAEILDTKVSGLKRFEWLEKHKKKGTKVLIMNMSLVQVGLDLLEWPTIIYYQLNDDLNVLRQAGGRNWRIGQHRNAKIYYLVNQETQQMAQFERLMTRRIEALLVEGRINRSDELAQFAKDNESKLARDLSDSLQASELEEKWLSAAEKDVDQDIEMVDESEIQTRISKAFETLTAETKRLCGVPIEAEKSNVIPFVKKEKEVILQEVDLFNFEDFLGVEKVPKKKRGSTGTENIEQVVFNF